ncbi:MAG: NosD domain-containing protein, partial [Acidobacteriota bacterium]
MKSKKTPASTQIEMGARKRGIASFIASGILVSAISLSGLTIAGAPGLAAGTDDNAANIGELAAERNFRSFGPADSLPSAASEVLLKPQIITNAAMPVAPLVGSTYVVKSTTDTPDWAPGDNVCSDAVGKCTLRAAIQEANAHAGTDTIQFAIGTGLQTITPATALPDISESVTIDATTQPGYVGVPLIELNGGMIGSSHDGLYFLLAGNSIVRGLIIEFFRSGIYFDAGGNNVVENCYIGTDPTGTLSMGNDTGIFVNSTNNRIGGLSPTQRNVISGNSSNGILLFADGNTVVGNYIGPNAAGTAALAGGLGGRQFGVDIQSNANTIGSISPGSRNLISGNAVGVILTGTAPVTASSNVVQGNYIGTDVTGAAAVGNSSGGVRLRHGATNNLIGGTSVAARNIISGNTAGHGISIEDPEAFANLIQGNFIGTDVTGNIALGNSPLGVEIANGAANNTIGGGALGAGNVISSSADIGIGIYQTSNCLIQHNLIGTNAGGTGTLGNGGAGVFINGFGAPGSSGTVIQNNLISANNGNGISIGGSDHNLIQGNLIGTDAGGTVDLGNAAAGIALNSAAFNTIGGNNSTLTNLISGNNGDGVVITGGGATNNDVLGNLIGTDITGNVDLGNGQNGVKIDNAPLNTVGAATAQNAVNTISGNDGNGVLIINPGATNDQVVGNRVGTNAAGTSALPNGQVGVSINAGASSNKIGDLTPTPGIAPGNLISGQTIGVHMGVRLTGTGTRLNTVFGNLIGTKVSGSAAIPNGDGVFIDQGASQNSIGEKLPNARNLISGNTRAGIVITDSGTKANQVQNNLIGTDITGNAALGNLNYGVIVSNAADSN